MKMQERELTQEEQRRKIVFEKISEEMKAEGYVRQDLTVNIVAANIWGIVVMIPFMILFGWLSFTYVDGWNEVTDNLYFSFLLFPALLTLFVLHEVVHGLVWGLFAGFRSIRFGMIWKMLTPYCTCSSILGKWQYVLGSAMPTILLGFLMSFIAIYMDNILLSVLSLIMILAGGGDFLIILKLLSHSTRGKEVLYIDHPYECGLVTFER